MKYLALTILLVGCEPRPQQAPSPETDKVENVYPVQNTRCAEFNRQTTRKGELWTCRVLFCDSTIHAEAGLTTLWCDKDEP